MTDMISAAVVVLVELVARLPRWVRVLLALGLLVLGAVWGLAQLLPGGSADRLVLWLLVFDLLGLGGLR